MQLERMKLRLSVLAAMALESSIKSINEVILFCNFNP